MLALRVRSSGVAGTQTAGVGSKGSPSSPSVLRVSAFAAGSSFGGGGCSPATICGSAPSGNGPFGASRFSPMPAGLFTGGA